MIASSSVGGFFGAELKPQDLFRVHHWYEWLNISVMSSLLDIDVAIQFLK